MKDDEFDEFVVGYIRKAKQSKKRNQRKELNQGDGMNEEDDVCLIFIMFLKIHLV